MSVSSQDLFKMQEKPTGMSPLSIAAHEGNAEAVQSLINQGAVVEGVTGEKHQPLWYAVHQHSVDTVRCLLDNGINPERVLDSQMNLVSHVAVVARCTIPDVADDLLLPYLLNRIPEIFLIRNKKGLLPHHVAAKRGDTEAVRMIEEGCPDVKHHKTQNGEGSKELLSAFFSKRKMESQLQSEFEEEYDDSTPLILRDNDNLAFSPPPENLAPVFTRRAVKVPIFLGTTFICVLLVLMALFILPV
eukprot:TRINITY_DN25656_c0_g1_i1.p1 TRINITY_DN25656_c0_g1~~TRINITY_DN25656_c0_g1_i1.p1  ORF type:complete len:245 (-),score=37.89 TRINITY_DN25656_c0_g1_i1:35-769(-)